MNNLSGFIPLMLLHLGDKCFDATKKVYGTLEELHEKYINFDLKNKDTIKTIFDKSFEEMAELRLFLLDVIKEEDFDK
jgi:hypothetical protein